MATRERELIAAGVCPFCLPNQTCLLCQGDFARIAERLEPGFRPRAELCSDGRGGTRPSWYQGQRGGEGRGRRSGPAQAERALERPSRGPIAGLS